MVPFAEPTIEAFGKNKAKFKNVKEKTEPMKRFNLQLGDVYARFSNFLEQLVTTKKRFVMFQ